MKPNVYDFLLRLYVGADELRKSMTKPSLCGDVVCATDAHTLIMIDPAKCGLPYREVEKYPNIQQVIPQKGASRMIHLADMVSELAKFRMEYPSLDGQEECDSCDGHGETHCEHCGHDEPCEDCQGVGYFDLRYEELKKNRGSHRRIKIGERNIGIRYALQLADTMAYLGVSECTLLNSDAENNKALFFQITPDVQTLIMPIVEPF